MLSSENLAELAAGICATAETLGQTISATAARLMAEDLSVYPPHMIKSALQSCRRELTGKFTLGAVMQRIQAEDGRPGKDEAWSIAVLADDEFETVVMTDEIHLALTAARPVLESGNKIGARMVFLDAYERFVRQAREAAKPVNWRVSMGYDTGRRAIAIEQAVQMQRIPHERGQQYLADLRIAPVTEDGRAIAGLITGAVVKPSPDVREKIQAVRTSMLDARQASAKQKQEIREEAERQFADRREELMRQVEQLQAQGAAQ